MVKNLCIEQKAEKQIEMRLESSRTKDYRLLRVRCTVKDSIYSERNRATASSRKNCTWIAELIDIYWFPRNFLKELRRKMALITASWSLDVTLILLSFAITAYLYMTRRFKYWEKRGVMEIPPVPFLGNFSDCFFMRKCPGEFIKDLYDNSKGLPYMGFYIFDKPSLLVRDPQLIKHVLVKDFSFFADKYSTTDVKDRLGCTNLFMIKNPAWKVLRSKLTPIFTSGKLKKMFELMLDVGEDLQTHLESLSLEGKGKTVDVKDICAKFTTDLIGTTAYGLKVNCLNNPNAEFRECGKKIFDFTMRRGFEILTMFFMPSLIKIVRPSFFGKESGDFLRRVFWDTADFRMKSEIKRGDLIDVLIELKKNHENEDLGGFRFDGDDLVAQAAVFFTGGFETSSTTLAFSLYELALQPEIQRRLRSEILEALKINNGKVTYEMVMGLTYLEMVVSETLRKYPALPFLERLTGEDYKIPNSNVKLEKGTPVYISNLGLHYDSQYFPEPQKYDPERFSEEKKKSMTSCVYLPFGEGPHMCIGMRLGLLESKYGLVQILRNFEVSPCEKTITPIRLNPNALTTTALDGLYLNIRKLEAS
ncbi:hypothetical protein KPH14_010209 [Odynerus spinipes]|uniref:Cytochrome P450 n=1 Tax=Odynerus spinipes TaxID=1348599 RepID=A0AAD9VTJ5_9HYME|nr:hypothetical protein KPH14_010209 [Odynerus spinipes]